MATYDISRSHIGHAGLVARLSHSVSSAFGAVSRWRTARQTREALHALSDRELDDIGLNRGMIDDVANWR